MLLDVTPPPPKKSKLKIFDTRTPQAHHHELSQGKGIKDEGLPFSVVTASHCFIGKDAEVGMDLPARPPSAVSRSRVYWRALFPQSLYALHPDPLHLTLFAH